MRYVKQIDYETVYSFRKEGVLPYFPGSAYDADSVGNACRADYPIRLRYQYGGKNVRLAVLDPSNDVVTRKSLIGWMLVSISLSPGVFILRGKWRLPS